ncbi:MAG TPA: ABC transporter permease [Longimicrobiales bacterium]|nr:ABC transporter permease [Longimicrobiales bacterium]
MSTTRTEGVPVQASVMGARRIQRALPATLGAIYIIWYRDVLRFWRDRARLVASLAQPLLYLLIFGTGLSSALRGAGGGFGGAAAGGAASGGAGGLTYTQFIYPGIIGMAVLFSAIFGAMSIVWDREFGFLKEVLVAPIDRSAVAIGKSLGGATQAMVQGLVLLVLAPLVGVRLTPLMIVELVPLTFVLAFALSSLGVAIASRMRSMQGFQMIMTFLMMPAFFLSGALFPLQGLPSWMEVLTRLDPATYGMDPLRRVVLAASLPRAALDAMSLDLFGSVLSVPVEATIMLAFGALMLGFAIRSFRVTP